MMFTCDSIQVGAIILTHELNNFTMSEAVQFYGQLQTAFKHIVPVGVAYNQTQPYVETNYTLPTFEEYISGTTAIAPGENGKLAQPADNATTSSPASSASPTPTGTNAAIPLLSWSLDRLFLVALALTFFC
ncbi:hypothetical protein NP233_g512 [Leucocoprinus birnbaumii]|uniref:Chitin deacetylase n=1 Tax=Leucocoprinus birnbaumii TaxID=56174 RepID=A0AAD5W271_9AGAR|nr:hypothetical protein NP233_g512 [Leucocoprinus birnbaumii]